MKSHRNPDYIANRDFVRDGYLVFFKAESLKQKLICLVTGGEYSHCGIACWLTDAQNRRRLMLIESFMGGCRMITLSAYSGRSMRFIDVGLDWEAHSEYVVSKTGIVKYGLMDFMTIGFKDILIRLGVWKRKKKVPNVEGEVCSEMIADVLKHAGYPIDCVMLSPNDLLKVIEEKEIATATLDV